MIGTDGFKCISVTSRILNFRRCEIKGRSDVKIALLAAHKSYDYRIYRHIKMLNDLGFDVDYFNITNEENPNVGINFPGFSYKAMKMQKKYSFKTIKVFLFLRSLLKKGGYDYYFVQDEELLSLFLFSGKNIRRRVIIDSHELLDRKENRLKKMLIKLFALHLNRSTPCFTAVEGNAKFLQKYFSEIFVLGNLPLISDFPNPEKNPKYSSDDCKFDITYFGMITEENRQMVKTLEVMAHLLKTGKFTASLIGPIANRSGMKEIEDAMNSLKNNFPDSFFYFGAIDRKELTRKIVNSDFLLLLLKGFEGVSISPNKLYEALAAGLAVVTNREDFHPSVPREYLIVVDKNAPADEIANIILESAASKEKLAAMKEAGRHWLIRSNLTWESYRNIYEKVFNSRSI